MSAATSCLIHCTTWLCWSARPGPWITLQGWALPAVFAELRRLLEARLEKQGRREFVQVLRLLEVFPLAEVAAAIQDAIDRGALGFDAIKLLTLCQLLTLCRIEHRPAQLDLSGYP